MRGSARGASVVHLRTSIGARLQDTTLVHASQSGERQVIDLLALLAQRGNPSLSVTIYLFDAHKSGPWPAAADYS